MELIYHEQITRSALGAFFGAEALQAIIAANFSQDDLRNQLGKPHLHFDNDKIAEGLAYVEAEHRQIQNSRGNVGVQWESFGRLLHTVQDFYAHSNYVDLWLSHNGGLDNTTPDQINGLDRALLNHPDLRTGHFILWRDLVYFVPLLSKLVRRVYVPPNSHEAMHLDFPQRGPQFDYALVAARQRTRHEYDKVLSSLQHPDHIQQFQGTSE